MIRAIFFDIDGTLVSFKTHRIPESAYQALETLREQGIKLFIATGRHRSNITPVESFRFDGYITMNGGYYLDNTGEVIYKQYIPNEDIEQLIRLQQGPERFSCIIAKEKELFVNFEDDSLLKFREMLDIDIPPILPFEDWSREARGGVLQLIAFWKSEEESRIMQLLPGCNAMRWNPLFADVVPKGVNKQEGIDRILDHYGISLAETMAFGDGGNDMSMLQHVAVGIAMGNAREEVKKAADYVTDSVDENGIRNALKHFGLIK